MTQKLFPMEGQYEEYLTDESKYKGYAQSISFPESEDEIRQILAELGKEHIPVTVQGAKTGIVGGAIAQGGHIMNLSHMNRVRSTWMCEDGTGRIVAEPGINLIDLRKEIAGVFRNPQMFWPVDPTETSASIGGIAASMAQGISRVLYGASGQYIESVKVMDYQGELREYKSGQQITLVDETKVDALEMVLGKEGITGIITELTLKLIKKPEALWGIAFFFEQTEDAAAFVDRLKKELPEAEGAAVAAVEYIDRKSLDMIEGRKASMTKIKELPDIRQELCAMVYLELHGTEEGIEELAECLMEAAMEFESDPDEAWAVSGESEVEKLHVFRHAAAETVNLFIEEKHREDERITKIGMDLVIGDQPFSKVLEEYEEELGNAGITGCIFGHALENHLHVNLLPENYEQYCQGIELSRKWAQKAAKEHGKTVGEHGIGKLKRVMLQGAIPKEYITLCKKLKKETDEKNMINRGNIADFTSDLA